MLKGVEAVINCAFGAAMCWRVTKVSRGGCVSDCAGGTGEVIPSTLPHTLHALAFAAYRSVAWAVDEGGCLLRRFKQTGGKIALFLTRAECVQTSSCWGMNRSL